jgi:hypothetical protein
MEIPPIDSEPENLRTLFLRPLHGCARSKRIVGRTKMYKGENVGIQQNNERNRQKKYAYVNCLFVRA